MYKVEQILNTLKKIFKNKGIQYKDLAKKLGISEAALKRAFSEKKFSFERIMQICDIIEMDLSQVSRMALSEEAVLKNVLSIQQEILLADNPRLLTLFYLLLNGWTVNQFISHYHFSLPETIKMLITLEKNKLINLLPNNKVKLVTARNIIWHKNGPVRAKFEHMLKQELLQSSFDQENERLHLVSGELSALSIALITKKSDEFLRYYQDLVEADLSTPTNQKHSYAMMLAMRPWIASIIKKQKKER